jgi:hypothetical protein
MDRCKDLIPSRLSSRLGGWPIQGSKQLEIVTMKLRIPSILFISFLALVLGAGLLAVVWLANQSGPGGSSTDRADQEVCSHVRPGPLGAAGDWDTPAVAEIAYNNASPYIRDAYGAAVSASIPLGATPEQMQAVIAAWGHLGDVCAAVRARG